MFELFKDGRVIFVILGFSCQFSEFCDVVVNVASFHLQFVEFCRRLVVSICIVPVLDKILLELVPYIYVGRCRYWPSHDPIFYAAFPLGDSCSLYESEGVHDLSVRVGHN